MDYTIENIGTKKLAGKRQVMSFTKNTTHALWQSFMPHRDEIPNRLSPDLVSMQIYPAGFFDHFDPHAEFEKWAAIEVSDYNSKVPGMENFELPGGMYAVFLYKGRASEASSTYQYILGPWMKETGHLLDTRPHFEILGPGYKDDDPLSEEEIWIPVRGL
ncbi:MAG TPA: GyrI-like domain-containing protein [Bacteroidales bacterium]|nr:GyrI-like domain-containing protein [Bacteroidales bacterium]